jgi:hypothetical protein
MRTAISKQTMLVYCAFALALAFLTTFFVVPAMCLLSNDWRSPISQPSSIAEWAANTQDYPLHSEVLSTLTRSPIFIGVNNSRGLGIRYKSYCIYLNEPVVIHDSPEHDLFVDTIQETDLVVGYPMPSMRVSETRYLTNRVETHRTTTNGTPIGISVGTYAGELVSIPTTVLWTGAIINILVAWGAMLLPGASWLVIAQGVKAWKEHKGRCGICGYPLCFEGKSVCPECGAEIGTEHQ